MSAIANPMATPEWAQARADWRAQADASFAAMLARIDAAGPDDLDREDLYAPVHDIAGLAGVFEYLLLGKMARALMEMLRKGPDRLDASTLAVARTYTIAMTAIHARDLRGDSVKDGDAVLAELAAVSART